MKQLFRSFLTAGIDPDVQAEERRLLVFHRVAIVGLMWNSPVFGVWAAIDGRWPEAVSQTFMLAICAVALWLTLRGRHLTSKVLYTYGATALFAAVWTLVPTNMLYRWFLVSLIYAAAVFRGREYRWKWAAIAASLALFVFGAWFDAAHPVRDSGPLFANALDPARLPEYVLVSDTCAALTIALIVAFMSEQMRLAEKHLEDEHRKSEGLLLNILPKPIAERLKNEPQTIADGFPHVTVLFSDIVGFTPMSEQLAPEQLVEVLNKLFTGFDRIAAKHGLEKIKTIGDAYMVASGVPVPTVRHAHDVAEMAMRGLPCSPGRAARLAERSQTATSSGTGRARRVSRKARSHDRG